MIRPASRSTNGTASLNPAMDWAKVAYPATRLCTAPMKRPPSAANGTDRRPPSTAAAVATNST
jgi:hypothetical protein